MNCTNTWIVPCKPRLAYLHRALLDINRDDECKFCTDRPWRTGQSSDARRLASQSLSNCSWLRQLSPWVDSGSRESPPSHWLNLQCVRTWRPRWHLHSGFNLRRRRLQKGRNSIIMRPCSAFHQTELHTPCHATTRFRKKTYQSLPWIYLTWVCHLPS